MRRTLKICYFYSTSTLSLRVLANHTDLLPVHVEVVAVVHREVGRAVDVAARGRAGAPRAVVVLRDVALLERKRC